MRSVRRWLSVEWRSRSWQGKKNKKQWKRSWEERRATGRAGRTDRQTEGGTKRERKRKKERTRDSEGERENGDTWYSTAAVERVQCRGWSKKAVGRSVAPLGFRPRWGWNRVGRPERRCSRFVFLVDFSLSLYVPGGIAIAGPVKHGGIQILRLCELPTRVRRRRRRRRRRHRDRQRASKRAKRGTSSAGGWSRWHFIQLTVERMRVWTGPRASLNPPI